MSSKRGDRPDIFRSDPKRLKLDLMTINRDAPGASISRTIKSEILEDIEIIGISNNKMRTRMNRMKKQLNSNQSIVDVIDLEDEDEVKPSIMTLDESSHSIPPVAKFEQEVMLPDDEIHDTAMQSNSGSFDESLDGTMYNSCDLEQIPYELRPQRQMLQIQQQLHEPNLYQQQQYQQYQQYRQHEQSQQDEPQPMYQVPGAISQAHNQRAPEIDEKPFTLINPPIQKPLEEVISLSNARYVEKKYEICKVCKVCDLRVRHQCDYPPPLDPNQLFLIVRKMDSCKCGMIFLHTSDCKQNYTKSYAPAKGQVQSCSLKQKDRSHAFECSECDFSFSIGGIKDGQHYFGHLRLTGKKSKKYVEEVAELLETADSITHQHYRNENSMIRAELVKYRRRFINQCNTGCCIIYHDCSGKDKGKKLD